MRTISRTFRAAGSLCAMAALLFACGAEPGPDAGSAGEAAAVEAQAGAAPGLPGSAPCRRWQLCTPANPCHTGWVTGCRAGVPICTDIGGWLPNGSSCGQEQVCHMGECQPCAAGSACASAAGPCHLAAIACSTGLPVCQDTGAFAPDGSGCGQDAVCYQGACNWCPSGWDCSPSDSCTAWRTDCSAGWQQCLPTTEQRPDGSWCGDNRYCQAGVCDYCYWGQACPLPNPCHVGYTDCSSGRGVCLDYGWWQPDGTSCGADSTCWAGECISCVPGAPCGDTPCQTGHLSCSTGSAICNIDFVAPDGTACGAGVACLAGQCVDVCTATVPCTPADPCHDGQWDCTGGSPVCRDLGTVRPEGASCGPGLTCRGGQCLAARRGIVVGGGTAVVFDVDADAVLGTVAIGGSYPGTCAVLPDGTLGLVGSRSWSVWAIDLFASPPALAAGTNPVAVGNFGGDVSASADGRFLVVGAGSSMYQPIAVVDVAARSQVSAFTPPRDCLSLAVCDDGSVVYASSEERAVRRLTLSADGTLADTGEAMSSSESLERVACAPGSASGLATTIYPARILSFSVPGLAPVSDRALSALPDTGVGLDGLVNPAGTMAYVRSRDMHYWPLGGAVDVFPFDAATGAVGEQPLHTITGLETNSDGIAIHPDGTKLYAADNGVLRVYDAASATLIKTIFDPAIVSPVDVCVVPAPLGADCTPPGQCFAWRMDSSSGTPVCTPTSRPLANGTSCGDGLACMTGQCVPAREVRGTAGFTYWTASGPVGVLPRSISFVRALVPDGSGGYATIEGQVQGSSFVIPGVPQGSYLLNVQMQGRGPDLIETSASDVDLGADWMGRPDAVLPSLSTPVTFDVDGLVPWNAQDRLELISAGAGDFFPVFGQPPVTSVPAGSTRAAQVFDFRSPAQRLIDAALGDDALVVQSASIALPGTSYLYQAAAGAAPLPGFTVLDGVAQTAYLMLQPIAERGELRADWRIGEFERHLAAMSPAAVPVSHRLAVTGAPFAGTTPSPLFQGSYPENRNPMQFFLLVPAGAPDLALSGLAYGRGFLPSSFVEIRAATFRTRLELTAPGATPFTATLTMNRAELAAGAPEVVTPALSPAREPRLNGVLDAFQPQSGVGETPTLSWTPPEVGAPTSYQVSIYRLASFSGRSVLVWEVVLFTEGTSFRVPAGILSAGNTYVATILARDIPGESLAVPYRQSWVVSNANLMTAPFQP